MEDMYVLDGAGDGVRVLIISLGSFSKSFIKIQHQEPNYKELYYCSVVLHTEEEEEEEEGRTLNFINTDFNR